MKKLFTFLTLLLCVASSAWADELTTLVDIDFTSSEWTNKTFSQGNTTTADVINGVYFYSKNSNSSKQFSLIDNTSSGLTFPENNISSGNYYFCIPLTGINGKIVVTLKHSYSSAKASYKYVFIDGRGEFVAGDTNGSSWTEAKDANNSDTEITFEVTATNNKGHLCIGRSSSSFPTLKGVIIKTSGDTRTDATLSFPKSSYSVNLGESFTAPTLTVDPLAASGEVTYSSSETSVATVDASTGAVTLGSAAGTTTITAAISNSNTYKDASAYYTLTVVNPDAPSSFTFGLTQNDLTTSTGISTTTTYTGNSVTLTNTNAAMSGSSSTRNLTNGTTSLTAANGACQRNNLCSGASDFVEASYYAFTLAIDNAHKLNISKIYGDLYYDSSRSGKYKFAVYKGDTKLWEASNSDFVSLGGSNNSQKTIDVSSVEELQNLKGTIQVRMVWYQGGSSSYVALKDFNITATIEEASSTMFAVTTSTNDDTMGFVTDSGEYLEGENVSITATPNVGNKFLKWVIDEGTADEAESTDNPYTFTSISAAHTAKAYFGTSKKVTYNILENVKGTRTDIFTTEYADDNDKFTIPAVNLYLSSDNKTLTGWTDASNNNYTPGQEITLTDDIVLSPVFTDNDGETFAATLEANKSDFSTTWSLSSSVSSFNVEQKTAFYVQQAEINGETVDVPMAIDATAGKVNNQGRTDQWAQTNGGTKFTIPVVNGSIITMVGYNAFKTEAWEEGNVTKQPTKFNGNMLTSDNLSSDSKTATYTYQGTTGTLVIEVGADINYTSTITVTYPSLYTAAPTIAAGAFSFENKYYPVTITGAAGTTKIETSTDDGATWQEQTLTDLACTVNVTAGQTLKARATAEGKEPSETVSFTNDFDATKKYVAWVYGTDGNYTQYNPATDKMVIALKEDYNVVAVGSVNTQSPSNDLNNADLIVCSEAMTGNKTFSNGMKVFAGVTPMIGLKAYNYTKGRWSWGTPANPSSTAQSFIPKSKLYKVLKNVSYETDGSIKLATATSGNVIQTVEFGTTDCTAPEGNVIMGTLDNNDAKAVMYASNKYFGLGLSCDCRETYTDNAITIIKNAAAMLIAGEDIATIIIPEPSDPEIQGDVVILTTTASMQGWRAFYDASSGYTLDENTKAYVATNVEAQGESDVVVLNEIDAVPAETAVLLKTTNETQEGYSMTLTKASNVPTPDIINKLKRAGAATNTQVYRLGANDAGVGFFAYTKEAAKPDVVVLDVDSSSAGARSLTIAFADDETTAIHNVNDNVNLNKVVFDMQGRRVFQPGKGLYIVNGKKVVIK